MKKLIYIIALFSSTIYAQTNKADSLVNLAIDAKLTGSIINGRGVPKDILYNPSTNNCVNALTSSYSEYGEAYGKSSDIFFWKAEFSEPKLVNYITFGGVYDNQPQVNTRWQITYKESAIGEDKILDVGVGGWLNAGNYEKKLEQPITIYSIKFEAFDSVSIHLRCRGGKSKTSDSNDLKNPIKSVLIQLLPYEVEVIEEPIDEDLQAINELIVLLQQKALEYNEKNDKNIKIVVVELDK